MAGGGNDIPRQRQWHSKTRLGCQTCKDRRIKCSQEKPRCQKCKTSRRECIYNEPPKAWIFNPTAKSKAEQASSILRSVNHSSHLGQGEQRAMQFFLEQTAPTLAAFTPFTKLFWENMMPSVAQSEAAVRHLIIALSTRQERVSTHSANDSALRQLQSKHFVLGLQALNQNISHNGPDLLLIASCIFIAYGNFDEPQEQNADNLSHLASGLRILQERRSHPETRKESRIVDDFAQPMLARVEMMMSTFMGPTDGAKGIHCRIKPDEPSLPTILRDLAEARRLFMQIVCWRYAIGRTSWTFSSHSFQRVRSKLLDWYELVCNYARSPESRDTLEQNRIIGMMSQFRLLFVAMIYSARDDLHGPDHLRPETVELIQPEEVSVTYHLPQHWLNLLKNLDWEATPLPDPMQVRLWPVAEMIRHTEGRLEHVSVKLEFRVRSDTPDGQPTSVQAISKEVLEGWYTMKTSNDKVEKPHLW